jgi:F0F1-type ATP synthase assembly protein I
MFAEFGCCNTLPFSGPTNYFFDAKLFTICPSKNQGFDPAGIQNRMTTEEYQSIIDLIMSQCGSDITCIKISRVLGLIIVVGIILAWIIDAITVTTSNSVTTSYVLFAISLLGLILLIYSAVKKRTILRRITNILEQENYTRSAPRDIRWHIDFRGRWFHVTIDARGRAANQSMYNNNSMMQMMPYGNAGGYGGAGYGQPVYGQPVGSNMAYQSVPITTVPLTQPVGYGQQQQYVQQPPQQLQGYQNAYPET